MSKKFEKKMISHLIRISGIGGDLGNTTATHYTNLILELDIDKKKLLLYVSKIPSNGGRKWYGKVYEKAKELKDNG